MRPGVDSVATLLFQSDFDPTSAKWQVSTNGGTEPLWSRNGRELFYRDGENQLVAMAITAGSTFSFGERKVLFSMLGTAPADGGHPMYDVSPDGSRFLIIRTLGGEDARVNLVVVDNFLAEVRQKTGAR